MAVVRGCRVSHQLPYLKWLAQLREGDFVIPVIHGERKEVQPLTKVSKTTVTIGKYAKAMKFSRKTGLICGKRPLKHLFSLDQP